MIVPSKIKNNINISKSIHYKIYVMVSIEII